MSWKRVPYLCAALSLAACQTSSIERHPEYAKIQEKIVPVVSAVRQSTGQELLVHLNRLVAYDVFAVKEVSKLVSDKNERLRCNALWVLAQIDDPGYPDVREQIDRLLWEGLEDPDRMVRYEAATGLLLRNHWEPIPVLLEGLEEPDARVRMNCANTLRQVTSRDFGYVVDGTEEERRVAIQRWRSWYSEWQKGRS